MNTELVICHAGEPMHWLHEIPEHVAISLYDTGARQSKHTFASVVQRKMGRASALPHENFGRGFPHSHMMRHHSHMQNHGQPAGEQIGLVAEQAQRLRDESDRMLHYVQAAATMLLSTGVRDMPQRTRVVPVTNDHHLRESAQWLLHIITRFDSLADVTVFTHGWPFDHVGDLVELVRAFSLSEHPALLSFGWLLLPFSDGTKKDIVEPPIQWMVENLLLFVGDTSDPQTTDWVIGTEFVARKEVLRAPGVQFWKDLLALGQTLGPRSAEAFERVYAAVLMYCTVALEKPMVDSLKASIKKISKGRKCPDDTNRKISKKSRVK